jgi:hypothetical protein
MVLVHERTALSLDTLVMAHMLIVVIVSRVGLVFLLEGLSLTLSPDTFPTWFMPTRPNGEVQRTVKTSSGRLVKC